MLTIFSPVGLNVKGKFSEIQEIENLNYYLGIIWLGVGKPKNFLCTLLKLTKPLSLQRNREKMFLMTGDSFQHIHIPKVYNMLV